MRGQGASENRAATAFVARAVCVLLTRFIVLLRTLRVICRSVGY